MAVSRAGSAVINTKKEFGAISLANFSKSTPSSPGIRMSEIMMSKICDSSLRLAASALLATSTRWPSLRKVISRSSQIDFSSSTTRMCGSSRPLSLLAVFVPCINVSRDSRQFDDELCAAVLLRDHADLPAVGLHDLIDNRQPQTCAAFKPRLEWLKNF